MNQQIFSCKKTLWAILTLAPFLFLLYWIVQFAIDMPYLDAWDLAPYLQKSFEGSLTFGDLFDQHNESRIFFPRLILIPLARLTGWNIHVEVAGIVILAALIFLLLARQSARTCRECIGRIPPWLAVIISFLVFSVFQYEAWTFGFTIIGFMNIAAVTAGLVLLARPGFSRARFLGALLAGAIAMFSYSNGILYWVAGLPLLAAVSWKKERFCFRPGIIWTLTAMALLAVYYTGYQKPSCMPPLGFFLHHPDIFIGYILAFLGGAIANTPQMPVWVPVSLGGIGCTLFGVSSLIVLFRTRQISRAMAFWFSLGIYAVLGAMAVAIGRSANGIPHALESRYTTLSNLFWISTLMLTFIAVNTAHPRFHRLLTGIKTLLCLLLLTGAGLFAVSSVSLLTLWQQKHADLLIVRNELLSFLPDQSILARSFPDPVKLKTRIDFLTRQGLSVFRDKKAFPEYKVIPVPAGKIESLHPMQLPVKGFQPNTFYITGRAYDPELKRAARAVLLVNTQEVIVARSHVIAADDYSQSSWKLALSTAKFPVGPVLLNVYTVLRDNDLIAPISVLKFDVAPAVDLAALMPIDFVDPAPAIAGCADHLQTARDQVIGNGWARNPATGAPGQWVIVTDETQKVLAYARVMEDRDDVARQLRNPGLIRSGWRIAFHQSRLSPGIHVLNAWLYLPEEHQALKLMNKFEVTIPYTEGTTTPQRYEVIRDILAPWNLYEAWNPAVLINSRSPWPPDKLPDQY